MSTPQGNVLEHTVEQAAKIIIDICLCPLEV